MQNLLPFLTGVSIKSAVVLLAALVVIFLMRRNSAAARHLVWTSAVAGVLALPLLSVVLPGWSAAPLTSVVERVEAARPAAAATPAQIPREARQAEAQATAPRAVSEEQFIPARLRENFPAEAEAPAEQDGMFAAAAGEGVASASSIWSASSRWAPWAWLGGALFALLPVIFGCTGLLRLRGTSRPVSDPVWLNVLAELRSEMNIRREVRLLESPICGMPMTWGATPLSPARIAVPEEAVHEWSADRRRAVLLHELAHVKRWDCLTQVLTHFACAIYWFNPLIWLASHRMLVERERACDDLALQHDLKAPDYARHLLEIAAGPQPGFFAGRAGVAMARRSNLGDRMAAILDQRRNRKAMTRLAVALAVTLLGTIVVPFAMLQAKPGESEAAKDPSEEPEAAVAELMTEEAGVFDFRVVDGQSGQPVPGAKVRVQDPHGIRDFETDAEGLSLVPLRVDSSLFFWVRVWADGFVPVRVLWRAGPGEAAVPASYTLELTPGTAIGGRVVDDAGEPVSRATVALHIHAQSDRPHESVGIPYTEVVSGEDGRWEYAAAPAEFDRIQIGVHHPDYASHSRWRGSPMAGSFPMENYRDITALRDGSAEHVLECGVGIEVLVRDARGEPAEGASVGIGFDRFASNLIPELKTDADGRVRVAVHPDDEVVLTVKHAGHAPEVRQFLRHNLPEEVIFQLSPGHLFRGRVVDGKGQPVAGARVVVDTWKGTRTLQVGFSTDEDGWFEWADAPEGAMLVDVLAFGYADKRNVSVQIGSENRIELTSPLVARGRVVDAPTGEPVRRFEVDLGAISTDNSGTRSIAWWQNDPKVFDVPDGRFEIAPETSYWAIRVVADGYQVAESSIFAAADGDQDLTFELEPEEWIGGRVVDVAGDAVAGAEVILAPRRAYVQIEEGALTESSRASTFQAMTDPAGRFSLPPQADAFTLIVLHESGYGELRSADFFDSGEVVLQLWGRIEGQVNVPGLAAGERITCRYVKSIERVNTVRHISTALTNADGRFVFDRVPPGDVVLARTLRSRRSLTHPNQVTIEVAPGETVRASLGGPGRLVVGRVSLVELEGMAWAPGSASISRLPEGTIPANLKSMTFEERRQWRGEWLASEDGLAFLAAEQRRFLTQLNENFVLQADGSFRIEDLEPGDYSLSVAFRGSRPDADGVHRAVGRVTHDFTVPEIDGAPSDEPLELPLLEVQLTQRYSGS